MAQTSELCQDGSVIRFDTSFFETFEPRLFELGWLRENDHLAGTSRGRSQAYFITYRGHELVWRHFRRGGLIGRINPDLYLGFGAEQSRAFREFELLALMHDKGLPVPRPVAARYVPSGPFYRGDLMTERIPDAQPLEEALRAAALTPGVWREIGATIRRFHDAGIDHTDLNCRNVLLDAARRVWLIDFDKCKFRPPGDWAQRNLNRLHRSFLKEDAKPPGLHWTARDWEALLSGYGNAPA